MSSVSERKVIETRMFPAQFVEVAIDWQVLRAQVGYISCKSDKLSNILAVTDTCHLLCGSKFKKLEKKINTALKKALELLYFQLSIAER